MSVIEQFHGAVLRIDSEIQTLREKRNHTWAQMYPLIRDEVEDEIRNMEWTKENTLVVSVTASPIMDTAFFMGLLPALIPGDFKIDRALRAVGPNYTHRWEIIGGEQALEEFVARYGIELC